MLGKPIQTGIRCPEITLNGIDSKHNCFDAVMTTDYSAKFINNVVLQYFFTGIYVNSLLFSRGNCGYSITTIITTTAKAMIISCLE
ncbi:hypothetical protein Xmau_02359 [Xenorhabdus mauleonii]|uniref:Uncharacterized protein n=1 Tax=Xenorhabdus mauleonii TaxID=351675 RepID=A0A1I3TES2_9GAMM|nr:hypothetical protein Xmau_02359 [Xenorhabdus mauleonii]SFJ69668.1 hypothetical protein SAMN05421680_1147 [Xenorhabdus mauleonii]